MLHEESLRALFACTCCLGGQTMAGGLANELISYDNWKDFLRLFSLVDVDCPERNTILCFVWARMKYIDEQSDKGRIKWTHLSFEDFLEALCRLACLKAFPDDAEIAEAVSKLSPGLAVFKLMHAQVVCRS